MPGQQFDETTWFTNALEMTNATTPGTWVGNSIYNIVNKRIDMIQIANSDSIAHNISLDWAHGDGTGVVGSVLVPARAGYDGAVPVDALGVLLPAAFHYVNLQALFDVFFSLGETITAGQHVTINQLGGLI